MTNSTSPNPPEVVLDEIGQIAVTVTDLARSRDFYQNVLGMQFLFDAGSMVFFQCGKMRLERRRRRHRPEERSYIFAFPTSSPHRRRLPVRA